MSYSRNQVELIGHVVRDPKTQSLENGGKASRFTVATSDVWTNDAGERQERPQFHLCVAFGKVADRISQYVKQGDLVAVTGQLEHREYEKDGQKRNISEVVLRGPSADIGFLKSKASQPA